MEELATLPGKVEALRDDMERHGRATRKELQDTREVLKALPQAAADAVDRTFAAVVRDHETRIQKIERQMAAAG